MIFIRAYGDKKVINVNHVRYITCVTYTDSSLRDIVWTFDDNSEFAEPWSQERWDYIVVRLP